ncbi:MAG TPA: GTPase RsgA, partial [Verrucomicrobiae bacterium]|nr:GTPase RsgA [Verrucomicrobiae bacterium]
MVNKPMDLIRLGWCDFFAASFAPYSDSGLGAARVGVGHRGGYGLYTADGECFGQVSGRFRHGAAGPGDFPVVGDWVAIEAQPDGRTAIIHAVLPRRSKFSRAAPGDRTEEQVLAANMDDVWIVAALAADLNLRRIERYLALAWQSGAQPGLVLTKADLCGDVATAAIQAEASARGVSVWVVSSLTGDGVEVLRDRLRAGRTGVLLGPSGVGKSTL